MKNTVVFAAILILVALFLTAGPAYSYDQPLSPIKLKEWFIGWDRLTRTAIIESLVVNSHRSRLSGVTLNVDFIGDTGKIVAHSRPWQGGTMGPGRPVKMKTKTRCPHFEKYRITVTGKTGGKDFEQLLEGVYYTSEPGATPPPPRPVSYARGSADVRVIGSREEHVRTGRKGEGLALSGQVQNLGDCPAENIVLHVTFMNAKRAIHREELRLSQKKLMPDKKARFHQVYKRVPPYTAIAFKVDFKSIEGDGPGGSDNTEAFKVEAPPILVSECAIEQGLFTGKLQNTGSRSVKNVIISIVMKVGQEEQVFEIKPGGVIEPGFSTDLIKACAPKFDTFTVGIKFQDG